MQIIDLVHQQVFSVCCNLQLKDKIEFVFSYRKDKLFLTKTNYLRKIIINITTACGIIFGSS